ncbi:MAG: hypothetical protein NTV70_12310 [Acidobacteria bacterium]|nr:hypothetical protein [Acidobacteriota bacterium]
MSCVVENIAFRGWPNCWRVANDAVEIIATADVGPRIISLRLTGGDNLLFVREEFAGLTGGAEWRNYGGHRLWHAPEDIVRTREPDNAPVKVQPVSRGFTLIAPVEPQSRIGREITVELHPTEAKATVSHRLINHGLWPVELAPWALSVMAPGGFAICPMPKACHPDRLLPNRALALWPYSDLTDGRYLLGKDYVLLRHDGGRPEASERAKIGVMANDGWTAYALGDALFVKRFPVIEGARYPDYQSTVELFTNNRFLELETLGPLQLVAPGAMVEHVEQWEIHGGLPLKFDEASVSARIAPLLAE